MSAQHSTLLTVRGVEEDKTIIYMCVFPKAEGEIVSIFVQFSQKNILLVSKCYYLSPH